MTFGNKKEWKKLKDWVHADFDDVTEEILSDDVNIRTIIIKIINISKYNKDNKISNINVTI